MSAAAIYCYLFGHKFGRWARATGGGYIRVCQRCVKIETDAKRTPYTRKLRAGNDADTTRG